MRLPQQGRNVNSAPNAKRDKWELIASRQGEGQDRKLLRRTWQGEEFLIN